MYEYGIIPKRLNPTTTIFISGEWLHHVWRNSSKLQDREDILKISFILYVEPVIQCTNASPCLQIKGDLNAGKLAQLSLDRIFGILFLSSNLCRIPHVRLLFIYSPPLLPSPYPPFSVNLDSPHPNHPSPTTPSPHSRILRKLETRKLGNYKIWLLIHCSAIKGMEYCTPHLHLYTRG